MVLELKVPHGIEFSSLKPVIPVFFSYLLSFIYLGIYWNNLNPDFLSHYQVVIFLDTRPDTPDQRASFEQYMEKGGAWMGFHFAGFALTPSDFPQNWDWYHNQFLDCGEYKGNTWRPMNGIAGLQNNLRNQRERIMASFSTLLNTLRKFPPHILSISFSEYPRFTNSAVILG
jgi:hypothetical protein